MNKDRVINIYVGLIWFTAVLSYLKLISIPLEYILFLVAISYFVLLIFNIYFFNNLLTYAILLSPIFGSFKLLGINVLFSDIFLIFSLLVLIIRNILPSNSRIFYLTFFLIFIHTLLHLLLDDLISVKPFISLFEIFIVYYLSKETTKVTENNTFLFSVIISTSIGVLLMFLAFYNGINLNDFEGDSKVLVSNASDLDLENYRMSYFYTNFPFIISSVIFILLYFIKKSGNFLFNLILIISILLICLALVASGNKTTMITTFVIYILSNFIFSGKSIYGIKNILYLIMFIPILLFLIYNLFLNDINSDLFSDRMLSSASFEDRIGVYTNVIHIIGENIYRIVTGYGADFLTGAGDFYSSNLFKMNYYTKSQQGAVDSGIITFIIEFGIFMFFLFTYIIFRRIKSMYYNLNEFNILNLQIFFVFIISSTTQLLGLSKIFWFFVIFYTISKYSRKSTINDKVNLV